jgi:hypothetical protein
MSWNKAKSGKAESRNGQNQSGKRESAKAGNMGNGGFFYFAAPCVSA